MSQFRIKNGLIIDNGGIAVTGSISSTAGITGSFSGSIAGFPTDISAFSSSLSSRIAANEAKTGSYATTGSNQFSGSQTVTGSLTVTGNINAQTLVVQTITSSIDFVTGSTRYGSTTDNTHQFTGSVLMSGSVGIGGSPSGTYGKLSVAGGISILNDNNAKLEIGRYSSGTPNSYIKIGANSDSLRFTNNTDTADLLYLTNSGSLGIGTTPSTYTLDVNGTGRFSDRLTAIDNANVNAIWSVSNSVNGVGIQLDNSSRSSGGRFGILVGNVSNGTFSIKDEINNVTRFQISSSGAAIFSNNIIAGSGTDGNGYLMKSTDGSIFRVIDPTATGGISTVNFGAIGTSTGNVRIHATDVLFLSNSGNIERMRITSSGSVGIGTTNPIRKLTVQGADDGTLQIRMQGTTDTTSYSEIGREAATTGEFRINVCRTGTVINALKIVDTTGAATFSSSVTATAGLTVGSLGSGSDAVITLATNASGSPRSIYYKASDATINFTQTGGANLMTLTNGGNLGIGTTNPSRKLTVSNTSSGDTALFTNTVDADLNLNLTSGVTLLSPSTGILAFGTSLTERMRINANGQVTLPYQPAFYAYAGAGGPSTRTTGAFTGFNLTRVNRGSHYNTSNGRFTAPIAGVYEFVFSMLWRNDSGDTGAGEISIGVNGSNVNSRGIAYSSSPSTVGYHAQTNVHVTLSLSAGDYVTGWVHFSGNTVGNWYYGDNLASFSGKLLG
jgi:hypothetical protein